jgi:hypothetical protein
MIFSLTLGLFYYWLVQVEISEIKNGQFTIESKIEQEGKFHIKVVDKPASLVCNEKNIAFDNNKTHTYFYRGEEEIFIYLKRGENSCEMSRLAPTLGYKIGYLDYIVIFILLGIPIYQILFNLLIYILERRDES